MDGAGINVRSNRRPPAVISFALSKTYNQSLSYAVLDGINASCYCSCIATAVVVLMAEGSTRTNRQHLTKKKQGDRAPSGKEPRNRPALEDLQEGRLQHDFSQSE